MMGMKFCRKYSLNLILCGKIKWGNRYLNIALILGRIIRYLSVFEDQLGSWVPGGGSASRQVEVQ